MKKTKKILSVLLAAVMVFSAMSLSLVAGAVDFHAKADGLWADPADGLVQGTVTNGDNTANKVNATALLDFLDKVLAEIKIEGDVADIIKTVNKIGITVNINSVDGILGTIDSVAKLNAGVLTSTAVKVAFGYPLVTKNWTKGQTRAKTGDLNVLNNLIAFLADNQTFLAAFVANKTNIVSIETLLKTDVRTYLKQTLAKLIYNYDKDASLKAKYDACVVKTLDNIILEDALGDGLNGLLKTLDDKIKAIDNVHLTPVIAELYGWGFRLEGILGDFKYNDTLNLDATLAQIADLIYSNNKEYIKKMLYTYGDKLQTAIVSTSYGAPFASLLKFDQFNESSNYSFLDFKQSGSVKDWSVKGLNKFVGDIIMGVTTYTKWDNVNYNLGGNIINFLKWAIDSVEDKTGTPYENYDFSGDTTQYAFALAQMIVDATVKDETIKETLKSCKTTEDVVTKLVPYLLKGNDKIVISSKSTTWQKVLGDILGSFLDDYAVLYTDAKNTKRYVKGSATDVWSVLNYALNYYLVDLNLDTLFGLNLTKTDDFLAKLDKMQSMIFGSTLTYSKASDLIPKLLDAAFKLDLETVVSEGIEKAFTDRNKNVTAANLAYTLINNVLGAFVGKTVFTGTFESLEKVASDDSLETAVKNLLAGLNTRKADLIPVLLYVFSAIDADSYFTVTAGTDGAVTVTYAGKALTKGTDYTVSAAVNVKDKSAKLTVTGKGNYAGNTVVISNCKNHVYGSWTVSKKATCTATGTRYKTCTLCGKKVTETVAKIAHTAGTPTAVSSSDKATTSKDGKVTTKCKVCGAVMKTAKLAKVTSFTLASKEVTYTGKSLKPAVTVKDSNGKKLKEGTDYTLKYSDNKYVGQASVKITLKGNYSGSKTLKFKIVPKSTKLSKVEAKSKGFNVTWSKQTTQTTGYEIQYSTDKKFSSKKSTTVNISSAKTTSKKITGLKASTTYYVRIRTYKTVKIDGKNVKLYSSWSSAKSVKTGK